jgi:hypothetical protein
LQALLEVKPLPPLQDAFTFINFRLGQRGDSMVEVCDRFSHVPLKAPEFLILLVAVGAAEVGYFITAQRASLVCFADQALFFGRDAIQLSSEVLLDLRQALIFNLLAALGLCNGRPYLLDLLF